MPNPVLLMRRPYLLLCGVCCVAALMIGCGDTSVNAVDDIVTHSKSDSLGASSPQWAENTPDGKRQRHSLDKTQSRELMDDPGAQDEDDDPRFVRETGFRPIDDGMSEVRETGFLPAPDVRLLRVEGEIGVISWGVVEAAVHYTVYGLRQAEDGSFVETFDVRVEGTTARVDTGGFRTVVNVYSVAQDGKRRSGPSNKVAIVPAD
jgi:hypothetical protein